MRLVKSWMANSSGRIPDTESTEKKGRASKDAEQEAWILQSKGNQAR